jgi:glycosyltransferase involved in cell wall biosynthesis
LGHVRDRPAEPSGNRGFATLAKASHKKTPVTAAPPPEDVVGWSDGYQRGRICGWAWYPANPDRAVTVELVVDDVVLGEATACMDRPDLKSAGIGNGRHAFAIPFSLDPKGPPSVMVTLRAKHGAPLNKGVFELTAAGIMQEPGMGRAADEFLESVFGLAALTRPRADAPPAAPALKVNFILYAATANEAALAGMLGAPEYSYFFVMRAYRAVLRRLGTVHVVANPQAEVGPIHDACAARGETCLYLSFAPPHRMVTGLPCPTIPVIAWEFGTIPTESWDSDIRNDWRYGLRQAGRAITLSGFAAQAIKAAMGVDFPVMGIAAPVCDRFAPADSSSAMRPPTTPARLEIDGFVLDTRTHEFALDMLVQPPPPVTKAAPMMVAPMQKHADFRATAFGGAPAPPPPGPLPGSDEMPMLRQPVLAESAPYRDDPLPDLRPFGAQSSRGDVVLDGVVFTAVFAPKDGRKNWQDLLTAFAYAFANTPDATLVLKMIGADPAFWWWEFHDVVSRLPAFSCRIVVLHGYLHQSRYDALIAATHFVTNASLAEGMCLPLVEFMSAGRPAIAPDHTAMADYIDATNALVVKSQQEYCGWPQDPRNHLITTRQRIEWPSVRAAMIDGYNIVKHDTARYHAMAEAARRSMRAYCGDASVATRLAGFLGLGPDAASRAGFVGPES